MISYKGNFHLVKNMCFPRLGLQGMYHYWKLCFSRGLKQMEGNQNETNLSLASPQLGDKRQASRYVKKSGQAPCTILPNRICRLQPARCAPVAAKEKGGATGSAGDLDRTARAFGWGGFCLERGLMNRSTWMLCAHMCIYVYAWRHRYVLSIRYIYIYA